LDSICRIKFLALLAPCLIFGGRIVEHFFSALNRNNEIDLDAASKVNDKDNLYVSKKVIDKISKYLERTPPVLRCSEISEEGWFNKKESYIRKRLRYNRKEGRYQLGISNLYRSFDGKRISRYLLYWLYDRDICHINNNMPLEPEGETVPTDTITRLYQIVDVDQF
jgi:hypothetical protein